MPTAEKAPNQSQPAGALPNWKRQLASCFVELDRRKTIAAQTQPIGADEFRRFIQNEAIPAFREFRTALAEHGDTPEYREGEDWVGLRWQEGHWIDINPLLRAPNRAAAMVDRARAYRERYGVDEVADVTHLTKEDILGWLVLSYAAFRRVSESELDFPAQDHLPNGPTSEGA